MLTKQDLSDDRETSNRVEKRVHELYNLAESRTKEYKDSQTACGCEPLCSFHENWKRELLIDIENYRQEIQQGKKILEELIARAKEAQRQQEIANSGYDEESDWRSEITNTPTNSRDSIRRGVCPKCDGNGFVFERKLFGTNDIGEEKCPTCKGTGKSVENGWGKCGTCKGKGRVPKTRGVFDMLSHGGGNRSVCSRCRGTGRV